MPPKTHLHLHEIVNKLLSENPKLRENSKKSNWMLSFKVVQEIAHFHHKEIFIPFDLIPFLPSFESIAREKRDILNRKNEFNDFVPDPNITYEKPIENKKEDINKKC